MKTLIVGFMIFMLALIVGFGVVQAQTSTPTTTPTTTITPTPTVTGTPSRAPRAGFGTITP